MKAGSRFWSRRQPGAGQRDFFWEIAQLLPGERGISYAHLDFDQKVRKVRGTVFVTDRRFIFVTPYGARSGRRMEFDLASIVGWYLNTDDPRRGRTALAITVVYDGGPQLVLNFFPQTPFPEPADEFFAVFAGEFARVHADVD